MAVSSAVQIGMGVVAAGAVAVGVVIVAPMIISTPDPAPEVVEIATPETPAVVADVPVVDAPASDPAPQIAPSLDTFRIEPDGSTVFAGRAAPMQTVDIMYNGKPIERVVADASGSFVAFPQLPFSDQSSAITLLADPDGNAVPSSETYLISPIIAPFETVAEAKPVAEAEPAPKAEPATPTEPEPVVEALPEPAIVAEAPKPDVPVASTIDIAVPTPTPEPVQPAAPAILVADQTGVRVVQPTISDASPDVLSNVALDSITYDPSGEVLIAGRASGGGFVQVYLDNQPVTTSRIAQGGNWRTDLPDIDTGVYTLRIDEIDAQGDVVSRVETPFKREEPEVVAQALSVETEQPEFQVAMTTVQPGTTLWAIAKDQFGSGVMYVEVFEANRDRIRDPNLIYPGQVFRMPQSDQ